MRTSAWLVACLALAWPMLAAEGEPAPKKDQTAPKEANGKDAPGEPKLAKKPSLPESPDTLLPVKLTGATYIHVRNGTPRPLDFTLYVECATGGTGKFDRKIQIAPGESAVWRLASEHKVVTTQVKGAMYYRVGLVGKDANNGREYRWGVVGGPGMYGKERQTPDAVGGSISRHIHVQPIGE